MQIFEDLSEVKKDKNTVLTLGTFDGIHLGHKKIIDEINRKTSLYNGRSFVVTFYPHPRNVLSKDFQIKILNTPREKAAILESLRIQNLLIIKFTKEFSQLLPEEFFKKFIVDSIGLREIIIGYDHHFGKGRSGDVNTLRRMGKENNFEVTTINEYKINGNTVSSTKIRNALSTGDINEANKFLGRYYCFSGYIVAGDMRGRTLGFPTANIKLDNDDKLLPAIGIYTVEFIVNDEKYYGLLSVGKRPTFYDEGNIVAEVYIYDFDENIYGKFVTVNLIERIRGEEKFNSSEELVEQMNKDKKEGLKILNKLIESEKKEV